MKKTETGESEFPKPKKRKSPSDDQNLLGYLLHLYSSLDRKYMKSRDIMFICMLDGKRVTLCSIYKICNSYGLQTLYDMKYIDTENSVPYMPRTNQNMTWIGPKPTMEMVKAVRKNVSDGLKLKKIEKLASEKNLFNETDVEALGLDALSSLKKELEKNETALSASKENPVETAIDGIINFEEESLTGKKINELSSSEINDHLNFSDIYGLPDPIITVYYALDEEAKKAKNKQWQLEEDLKFATKRNEEASKALQEITEFIKERYLSK